MKINSKESRCWHSPKLTSIANQNVELVLNQQRAAREDRTYLRLRHSQDEENQRTNMVQIFDDHKVTCGKNITECKNSFKQPSSYSTSSLVRLTTSTPPTPQHVSACASKVAKLRTVHDVSPDFKHRNGAMEDESTDDICTQPVETILTCPCVFPPCTGITGAERAKENPGKE